MGIYRGYEPATGCTDGPTQGARALQAWWTGAYGDHGAANLGVCNCKRLGSGWSLHAECRAGDLGTAPYNNPPGPGWPDWGWPAFEAMRLNSAELGIQLIIFRGKIWSGAHPDAGWRDYTGSNPHDGHGHVELSTASAASLTAQRIQQHLGGFRLPGRSTLFCKHGDRDSQAVEALQRTLRWDLNQPESLVGKVDGWYGDKTAAGLKRAREQAGYEVSDGGRRFDARAYVQLRRAVIEQTVRDRIDLPEGGGTVPKAVIREVVEAVFEARRDELRGEPGRTPTKVQLSLTGDVVEVE